MEKARKIVILIPSHNRKAHLGSLLHQINNQDRKGRHTVVTVLDGSTDGTREMIIDSFPEVRIVEGTGDWWYTRSMNEGFKYCQLLDPTHILALNDDIKLHENYLDCIIKAIDQVEENSIIGSLALTLHDPAKVLFSGINKYIAWRQKSKYYFNRFTEVNMQALKGIHPSVMLPGRGMLIPNRVLKELDFFDSFFVQYHSDEDFCLRARKKGYKVYISWDAKLFSYHKETGPGMSFVKTSFPKFIASFFNKYSRLHISQKSRFYLRHGPLLLWPLTMLSYLLSNLKSYLFSKKI